MHFGLDEEQVLLQESLRRFVQEELPAARLRACFEEGSGFDEALWHAAAGVGLPGLAIPEAFGGAGLELLDLALAFEVLGESATPGPFLGHALTGLAIAQGEDAALAERWLPGLASGEVIGGVALPNAAGDPAAPPLDWDEEGGRLSGTLPFAEVGPRTDLVLVGLAADRLGLLETRGQGVRIEAVDTHDRTRRLSQVHLEGAPIQVLSAPSSLGRRIHDAAYVLLAADAFGAAWRLIRATVDYCQTREQFSTPIAQFQSVKHQLANMACEAEPMRSLIWYAAYAFDHRPEELSREAATAKAHVTDVATRIGRDAVSLHGGIGFTWECDVHFFLKRAMHDRTWLGDPRWHRARLAQLAGW